MLRPSSATSARGDAGTYRLLCFAGRGVAAVVLASLLLLAGCRRPAPPTEAGAARQQAGDVPAQLLPLGAELDEAELSGLAWYGDWLVLLPQNPARFAPLEAGPGEGRVFALRREQILAALDAFEDRSSIRRDGAVGPSTEAADSVPALDPRPVPLLAPTVAETVSGFDGFEALAFRGDTAYAAIEAGTKASNMQGFVAMGRVAGDLDTLRLDARSLAALPIQVAIENFSYEALVAGAGDLLALYESNGEVRTPAPRAARLGPELQPLSTLPAPRLEYRVTDATAPDVQGRFWVSNVYWPGDSTRLRPVPDPALTEAPSRTAGDTQPLRERRVERLVEWKRAEGAVVRSGRAPIWLRLDSSGATRNWEGLARLNGRGFLIATDEHPRTLLGFVPWTAAAQDRAAPHARRARSPATAWIEGAETLFVVLAGLLLAVLGLLTASRPQAAWRFTRARLRRGSAYGLSLTAAVVFVGGAFWAFVEVAEAWTGTAALYRLDAAADRLARSAATPALDVLMRVVTWLGSGWAALLVVGGVAAWLYRQRAWMLLAILAVGFGAGEALVYGLKALFHRARPAGGLTALGESFPSGHAFTAALLCGLLVYVLGRASGRQRRSLRYAGAALLLLTALLVGLSRIYLRAHYLTDVVGGYLLALAWLAAAFALTRLLRERVSRSKETTRRKRLQREVMEETEADLEGYE